MSSKQVVLVLSLLLTVLLIVTGCAAPAAAPAGGEEAPSAGGEAAATDELEVFSWWTSGGEAAALDALFQTYSAQFPDVEIINATVAGGGGSAARGVLQTRLAGGDVPDTWQVHPGFELLGQYVDPEFVAPVTSIYEEEGWSEVVPEALVGMMSQDGEIYQVTVGVHRGNGFRYNKKLLEENGIEIGETLSIDEIYGIPITTLIFRNYFAGVPDELLDASRVDGAGMITTFTRVMLPLSIPAFVVVGIFQFTNIWNDFLFGVTVVPNPSAQPVTIALNNLSGTFSVDWNVVMAGAVIAALPTAIIYILLGRFFIRGILAGSVKG